MRKIFNLFVGMCKSQRDIQVEQRAQRIRDKKQMDELKLIHNALHIDPPRSPISSSSSEPEIASMDDLMREMAAAPYYNQYGSTFFSNVDEPYPAAPPPPPQQQPYVPPSSQPPQQPPPYVYVPPPHPPSYMTPQPPSSEAFGDWIFGTHLGDPGQGSSGFGGRRDNDDEDQQ